MKVARRKNRFAMRRPRPTATRVVRMLLDKAFCDPRVAEHIARNVEKNNALLQRIKLTGATGRHHEA